MTIYVGSRSGTLTLTLAYELTVAKGGRTWQFSVDAATGELIGRGPLEHYF